MAKAIIFSFLFAIFLTFVIFKVIPYFSKILFADKKDNKKKLKFWKRYLK